MDYPDKERTYFEAMGIRKKEKWREGVMDRVDIRSVESPGMDHLGEF